MRDIAFYIDISTQLNLEYTGIGNVNHQLLRWFRRHEPARSRFFLGEIVLRDAAVDTIVARKSGAGLQEYIDSGHGTARSLTEALQADREARTVGIFSTAKTMRRRFGYEAQVMHDITTTLMPEFHQESTLRRHGATLLDDLASDDLVVCVSQNTFDDLVLYAGMAAERLMVAHLGVDDVAVVTPSTDVEPFLLVLGTVEPRKNVGLVLSALRERPDLLSRWRVVFVGQNGWGAEFTTLLETFGLERLAGSRLLHLGYVPDAVRNALLANARCMIYPSLYEGFGLPVAEALRVGCPVITSRSSSLVEVGGPHSYFVDPFSVPELVEALDGLDATSPDARLESSPEARGRRQAWASQFTWDRFCAKVRERIAADMAAVRL